jgi:glutathione S-transferase
MRLYYSPGACSLSPHIIAHEAGLPVDFSLVTFSAEGRTTAEGENFFEVNPKGGYVPALRIDDTEVMSEGVAIVQYLADQAPEKNLTPEKGTMPYYHTLEWLTYISSEMHKGFGIFFRADAPETEKTMATEKLNKRFAYVESILATREYLVGTFSIADAYCYTILRWSPRAGIDLATYPNLSNYMKRMEARESVALALKEEGLFAFA